MGHVANGKLETAGSNGEKVLKREGIKAFLPKLTPSVVEHKFACYLELDYGEFPEIGRLCGKIPMFFHDHKPAPEHLDEAEEILRKLTVDAKMWIPKGELCGPDNVIRYSIIAASYVDPKLDCLSEFGLLSAAITLAAYYMDDHVYGDFTFSSVNESEQLMSSFHDIVMDIWQGKYESIVELDEQLKYVMVSASSILRFYWLLTQRFGSLVPSSLDLTNHLRKALAFSGNSGAALRIEAVGRKCSSVLFRQLRTGDIGSLVVIELYALGSGDGDSLISPQVRRHVLFKRMRKLFAEETGISNDAVSFVREMSDHTIWCNYVLRNVELAGMTYQQSFAHTLELIGKLRHDFLVLAEQLQEEFPDDDKLSQFIEFCKHLMDGNVYHTLTSPRYNFVMKGRELPYTN